MTTLTGPSASPFHSGEQAIHQRLGIGPQVEQLGRRMIRDHLPEQHQQFYRQLPYLVVGSSDTNGQPSASLLTGPAGFITMPDATTMTIAATPFPGDLLNDNLGVGATLGLLGIDLSARRRNRANGRINRLGSGNDGFSLTIDQAFGNCPQYITPRDIETATAQMTHAAWDQPITTPHLCASDQLMISSADTFFIASHRAGSGDDPTSGTDVSHRGGEPGFVTVEDHSTLIIPDYAGNMHFNTLGNLTENPQAGLLFVDFETGNYLQLSGAIKIIWSGDELAQFAGAERLLRFTLKCAVSVGLSRWD
ncbi:MAG: pyridoxamine 5'-phosphate oxidase family protein [Immundisolibacteraceae bacterium]|nr:pyridoxamine 5'-phosphate oxidase family protein [Immundisolibacteraceae bacterium]